MDAAYIFAGVVITFSTVGGLWGFVLFLRSVARRVRALVDSRRASVAPATRAEARRAAAL